MFQILNLSKHELDLLARFMGHDIRIHRDLYQITNDTLEMAKVSKLLVAMEQEKISRYAGKSLDDMEIDVDEEAEEEPPSESEDSPEFPEDPEQSTAATMNIQNVPGTQANRRRTPHTRKVLKKNPWTVDEKNSVLDYFSNEINLGIVPKKQKCMACIKQHPVLSNRSWSQIKFCVYNKIQIFKSKSPYNN